MFDVLLLLCELKGDMKQLMGRRVVGKPGSAADPPQVVWWTALARFSLLSWHTSNQFDGSGHLERKRIEASGTEPCARKYSAEPIEHAGSILYSRPTQPAERGTSRHSTTTDLPTVGFAAYGERVSSYRGIRVRKWDLWLKTPRAGQPQSDKQNIQLLRPRPDRNGKRRSHS